MQQNKILRNVIEFWMTEDIGISQRVVRNLPQELQERSRKAATPVVLMCQLLVTACGKEDMRAQSKVTEVGESRRATGYCL